MLEPKSNPPASHYSEVSTISAANSVTARQPDIPQTPNLVSSHGPEPWYYDCTADFFTDQLDCMAEVDLSRPHIWRLQ